MSWDDQKICWDECLKNIRFRSFSGPYFPAFRLNTERHCIQSDCGKIWTRKSLNTANFHAVDFAPIFFCLFCIKNIFWWYWSTYIYSYFSSHYIFHYFLSSTASVFLVVSFSSFIFSWTQAFLTVLLQWLSRKQFFFNPNYRSLRLSLFELALFIASFSFLQCFLILSGIYFRIRESIGIQKYKIGLYHFTLSFQFNTRCIQKIKDCLTFPGNIQWENWREIV